MGKAPYVLSCIALCVGLLMVPTRSTKVNAQTAPLPSCSGTLTSTPTQGRYTGPWHSDADYHFAVFNTDLDLTITIDGTLDVTVTPDGRVSGVARGTVDAPIHHDGIHDVSSGTGTISGIIQGVVTPSSSIIMLVQPVIAMQWGTGIPDGYTVPRSITMPNYQFPSNGADCISLHGAISEQNFPTQFVVADGASGLTQAAGIGGATGTWSLAHVESAAFTQLSQQVDAFVASANAALASSNDPLSTAAFNSSVLQPLKTLLASIHQSADISRCLLERLNAWVATTVPSLRLRAQGIGSPPDLTVSRQASDLARFAQLLQVECLVSNDGTLNAISVAETSALERAVIARDWSTAALAAREAVLTAADPVGLTQHFTSDVHDLLQGPLSPSDKIDVARVAYAIGDDVDARSATSARAQAVEFTSYAIPAAGKKHKKRKPTPKPAPTRTSTPTPKPTATPTPTATPKPISLAATLQSGVAGMTDHISGGATPSFSWQPVAGATKYVVFVSSSNPASLSWTWSGTSTSVQYGDTSLPGLPGSESDVWPVTLTPAGYTWSVLALNAGGHIIGLALRASA
jgi:hypothetical protein